MKEQQQKLNAVFQKMNDEKELSTYSTPPASSSVPSASPSILPSVAPTLMITTHDSTTAKVDIPSQRPSLSPSSLVYNDLATTMILPTSTTQTINTRKEPTSSSAESDLAFSSGNSEEDSPNVNDSSEPRNIWDIFNSSKPNAGLGIGMGLLLIAPLVIIVVVAIIEIKRRQRRRNRNRVVLPLQKKHITKDRAITHKRQHATRRSESPYPLLPISMQGTQIARATPTASVAGKDTTKVTPKAEVACRSKCAISAKSTDASKETKETTADVTPSQSTRAQIITSAPAKCKTNASDAEEMSTKDTTTMQEPKDWAGDGAQIITSAPTKSNESVGADIEAKEATTHVAAANSLKRETDDEEEARVVRESKDATNSSDEMSTSSSISTHSSGSIESTTSSMIQRTPKNLGAKKSEESTESADMENGCVTRQIATESTQRQSIRDSSRCEESVGAAAEEPHVVASADDIASRPKSETSAKGANTEHVTNEANTAPDEVSVNSSSSTKSIESVQSMTRFVIKSTKSLVETKDLKSDSVGAPTEKTRTNSPNNSSRIVKKDDVAINFSDVLSSLQRFFDCDGDMFTGDSPRTPSL